MVQLKPCEDDVLGVLQRTAAAWPARVHETGRCPKRAAAADRSGSRPGTLPIRFRQGDPGRLPVDPERLSQGRDKLDVVLSEGHDVP